MTTITITGAGGAIQSEIFLVADVLRKAGYLVAVVDPYYPEETYDNPEKIEETREHCIKYNNGQLFESKSYKCPQMQVTIKADHVPWGG